MVHAIRLAPLIWALMLPNLNGCAPAMAVGAGAPPAPVAAVAAGF